MQATVFVVFGDLFVRLSVCVLWYIRILTKPLSFAAATLLV